MTTPAWPTELRLGKDGKTLTIAFDTGERFELAAEYLRVKSPSAEVQGHSPEERKTVPGKRDVMIMEIEPVGNYAVRLVFDQTGQHESQWAAIRSVAAKIGCSAEALRHWVLSAVWRAAT